MCLCGNCGSGDGGGGVVGVAECFSVCISVQVFTIHIVFADSRLTDNMHTVPNRPQYFTENMLTDNTHTVPHRQVVHRNEQTTRTQYLTDNSYTGT